MIYNIFRIRGIKMKQTTVIIYALIMLECRLSLEDASKIFNIDIEILRKEITDEKKIKNHLPAVTYLLHETSCYKDNNKKGIFKASVYLSRLRKILSLESKEERITLLNQFIIALSGPNIGFAKNKQGRYSEDEKKIVLKHCIKYGCASRDILECSGITYNALKRWKDDLPEGELKARLHILNDYQLSIFEHYRKSRQ